MKLSGKEKQSFRVFLPSGAIFCIFYADNWAELENNVLEAASLWFEEEGRVVTMNDIRMNLDLPQFFEFYNIINASALSKRIKMNQSLLAQYISGHKKPSPAQLQRIIDGIRKVGRELADINIIISK